MITKKYTSIMVSVIVLLAVVTTGGLVAIRSEDTSHNSSSQSAHSSVVSYMGVNGINALALLKRHYNVTTKTYSGLGEEVISINGVVANSKKYWAFYVNGKPAQVGAGSYITKSSDYVTWKLDSI